jgi:hypothetical protein
MTRSKVVYKRWAIPSRFELRLCNSTCNYVEAARIQRAKRSPNTPTDPKPRLENEPGLKARTMLERESEKTTRRRRCEKEKKNPRR